MIAHVQPSSVQGEIQAPASKSAMQRACAAALLRKGETLLFNPGYSNDDRAALNVIQQLGAVVSEEPGMLRIHSTGVNPAGNILDCGESGLGIRMFTPIAALSARPITITGEGSLKHRPMDFFDKVLPLLGVQVTSTGGRLPLRINGRLRPENITVDGSLSSQFLTGLLMAYSAAGADQVSIRVNNLKSKPYIDLTLQVLSSFGLAVPQNHGYQSFDFQGQASIPADTPLHYHVEGDWSSASFLLVAGAVAGNLTVTGLLNTSRQADKKIIDVLLDAGAEVSVGADRVQARRSPLQGFVFDATDCPDLFPPIVALAANCNGITTVRGVKRLEHKESNRAKTLQEEFDKLSTRIDIRGDEMVIYGNGQVRVKNHTLNAHHDHRIAMACAVACLNADFEVQIRNAEAVNKSYPVFWEHLQQLNAAISLKP